MDTSQLSDSLSREGVAWVDRLKSGQMTEAEGEELKHWIRQSPAHRHAFEEAVALLQAVREAARVLAHANARTNTDAMRRAMGRLPPSSTFSRRAFIGGAVAASTAGAVYLLLDPPLGLWPSLGEVADDLRADYKTGIGEQRRIMLGQVAFELNTQTGLAVLPSGSGPGVRLIHGEAAVKSQGAPVLVQAGAGRVTATRAQFDVRIDDRSVCLTCAEGELALVHPLKSITLTGGQQTRYTDSEAGTVTTLDPALALAWQRGMLIFHDEPLSHVVEEINRYRKGRIVLLNDALRSRNVYLTVHLDQLDNIIAQLQHFSGARVRRVGQLVFLS